MRMMGRKRNFEKAIKRERKKRLEVIENIIILGSSGFLILSLLLLVEEKGELFGGFRSDIYFASRSFLLA